MKKFRLLVLIICILVLTACKPPATPAAPPANNNDVPAGNTPADEPAEPAPPEEEVPVGTMITVTSTDNRGPGTLREALQQAQVGDTIIFDPDVFPPDDPATIFITGEELPHIRTNYLTIDASNAGVILDGSQANLEWLHGLQIVSGTNIKIMGLQIVNFSGPAIGLFGEGHIIGGDRSTGSGPHGQGNLLINNAMGIGIFGSETKQNTITGNLIGTDAEETPDLGNSQFGISISEGAHDNTIGPNNIIANNGQTGIWITSEGAVKNIITQSSVYGHTGDNIAISEEVSRNLVPPVILEIDLEDGMVAGATCPNCLVDIFSTSNNGGEIFEGQAGADASGSFLLDKGSPIAGPNLTGIALDPDGNTGAFSRPFSGEMSSLDIQLANPNLSIQIQPLQSNELTDNHIGGQFDNFRYPEPETYDIWLNTQGTTWARVGIEGLECTRVEWEQPEFSVYPQHDEVITRMADNGLDINMVLTFWDKDFYPTMDEVPKVRFKTQAEIDRYLDYVRFSVNHFKDRVEYFEIWNEPELRWFCPQGIDIHIPDYINLVKQTVPVIREEYPEAKIGVGGVAYTMHPGSKWYLFTILESEIMPLVDVVTFHPMYGTSPEFEDHVDYYYDYPNFLEEIKETAKSHGFVGEYHADELTWWTEGTENQGQPEAFSSIKANKYFLRGALMNLGAGVRISVGAVYFSLPVFSTVMDGLEPVYLPIEVQSSDENIVSYAFSSAAGDYVVSLWMNGIAEDFNPGEESTITIPGISASKVIGIDPLFGFEQELNFQIVDGNLVIEKLMIKDYPILIRLEN